MVSIREKVGIWKSSSGVSACRWDGSDPAPSMPVDAAVVAEHDVRAVAGVDRVVTGAAGDDVVAALGVIVSCRRNGSRCSRPGAGS